jgi:hypothetical protein
MPESRKQFLVGLKGSEIPAAALQAFLSEVGGLEGVQPRSTRDAQHAVVQLTDAEAASLRDKYRDSLLIESDAPLEY